MRPGRRLSAVGLALMGGALLGGAAPAAGQIGALAAAAAAAGAGGEYALAGAPIFAESGLVLNDGWSAGAFGVTQSTTYTAFDGFNEVDVEFTATNLAVGAFFAAGEKAMIGAVLNPRVSGKFSSMGVSESVSGLGNMTVSGKFALSSGSSSQVAATASVELPIGDEDLTSQTATVSIGLGASKQLAADLSLHGGASVGLTLDDGDTQFEEGGTALSFAGAVVKQLNPKAWLSGELLGSSFDGEYQVLLAPGARFRAGERIFIDVGLAIGALSSDAVDPIDYGLAIGATLIPGR